MLPAENRLRRRHEFAAAVRRGRRAGRSLLVVHVHQTEQQVASAPRVGVVVGRTVGSAVVRNRVKRRLRHLLRDRVDRFPAGALVVVRALPAAASASASALAADLDRALGRVAGPPATTGPERTTGEEVS